MNIWMTGIRLMKHHYLKKKVFSHLNMEDITDADYTYAKEVCREYHELYIQNNNTLILIPRG